MARDRVRRTAVVAGVTGVTGLVAVTLTVAAVIDRTPQLANSGVLRVPEDQSIPVEEFSEAVTEPLLVFDAIR